MATTKARVALAQVVAANIRAEAARRGWTQAEMCRRLDMATVTMSDRYRERTPWTLNELERVAEAMGLEAGDLLARPKGFEPLTFWLGADHTVTVWLVEAGVEVWTFCDLCGVPDCSAYIVNANRLAFEHGFEHDATVERAA